ncbi:Gldg family protein [Sphingopyxis terrae]|uniref:Gldg family protein n=1 Tax=Sphingopyxis terrae TaxID=33052 RepID=UPI0007871A23|nr:hypothetical protein [Sphingopyxis terrae]
MTLPPPGALLRGALAAAALLALCWLVGGQAALGRIDPALLLPLWPLPLAGLAWTARRASGTERRAIFIVAIALTLIGQALLAAWLAGAFPWLQLVLSAGCGSVVAVGADRMVQAARPRGLFRVLLIAAAILGWFAAAHGLLEIAYRAPAPRAVPVTMMTSLPLRWSGGDLAAMLAEGARDDPALDRIARGGPLRLVDSLADHPLARGDALLLAHPPALAPRDLVAIDAFVRGGGRAVILADALSNWPPRHPLGDPRNPPVTSLLTPLLDHWGITLAAAPNAETRPIAVDVGGAHLRLFSAGRFTQAPPACMRIAGGHLLHCRIGQGDAWLVGDADMLFAPLWQPQPRWAAHLRRADTMEWLDARLRGGAARGWLRPLWIGAAAD